MSPTVLNRRSPDSSHTLRDLTSIQVTYLRSPVSSVNWVHAPSTKEEQMQDRLLTYDEQKAADAAFAGKPFNTDWSSNSKAVYDGIVGAMAGSHAQCELKPTGR